jgi:hypothetical protein
MGISSQIALCDNDSDSSARATLPSSFEMPMKMKKTSHLPIFSRHPFLRAYLSLSCILVLLLTISLACNLYKPNFGYPQPVAGPFTAKDCEIPGMPPPVTDQDDINNTNIYCVFHSGGSLNGVMYFSLNYSAKVDDALKGYTSWHDNIVNNYSQYTAITDTLEELFVMQVTTNRDFSNTDDDIAAVQIYEQHFVILIKGGLTNTSQTSAGDMVNSLFDYGQRIADEHYPGYH